MSTFLKAAKTAAERAAPLAGTAAVLAAQAPASAREVVSPLHPAAVAAPSSSALAAISRIQDEFELVDFDSGSNRPIFSKPIFTEDDITGAAQALRAFVSDEPDTDATSEGSAADAVIEALMSPRPSRQQAELDKAIFVATRLLRAPGVQREITAAALSDPAVLEALGARGPDLDGYLVSQGFAARGLLPGPSAVVDEASGGERAGADAGGLMAEGEGKDPLVALVDAAVQGLEWAGHRIADLGAWLRARLAPPAPAEAEGAAGGKAGGGGRPTGGPFGPGGVLDKVSKVAVLIVLLIVFKKAGMGFRPRA